MNQRKEKKRKERGKIYERRCKGAMKEKGAHKRKKLLGKKERRR